MIALQAGEVVGSVCIKRKAESNMKQEVFKFPWRDCSRLGKWNLFKLFLSLYLLDHQPQAGECYIEDIRPSCTSRQRNRKMHTAVGTAVCRNKSMP